MLRQQFKWLLSGGVVIVVPGKQYFSGEETATTTTTSPPQKSCSGIPSLFVSYSQRSIVALARPLGLGARKLVDRRLLVFVFATLDVVVFCYYFPKTIYAVVMLCLAMPF